MEDNTLKNTSNDGSDEIDNSSANGTSENGGTKPPKSWLSTHAANGADAAAYGSFAKTDFKTDASWMEKTLSYIPATGWLDLTPHTDMQEYHLNMLLETASALGVVTVPSGLVRVKVADLTAPITRNTGSTSSKESGMWEEGQMKGISLAGCWRLKGTFLPALIKQFRYISVLTLKGCRSLEVSSLCEALHFVKSTLRELDLSLIGENLADNDFGRIMQSCPQVCNKTSAYLYSLCILFSTFRWSDSSCQVVQGCPMLVS